MANNESENERNVRRTAKDVRSSQGAAESDETERLAPDDAELAGSPQSPRSRKSKGKKKRRKRRGDFKRFLRLIEELERADHGPSDASSSTLVSVLGSVPAFATSESMIAQSQAQGMMMANQVALQQKTNTIAMATTAACVSDLLRVHLHWSHRDHRHYDDPDDGIYDDEDDDLSV